MLAMTLNGLLWAAFKIGRRVGRGEITMVTGGQLLDQLRRDFAG